jgi:hypothetical protein
MSTRIAHDDAWPQDARPPRFGPPRRFRQGCATPSPRGGAPRPEPDRGHGRKGGPIGEEARP